MSVQLLRLLAPEERLLELHSNLLSKKICHEFFALPAKLYEKPEEEKQREYSGKFFKEGTKLISNIKR